MQQNSHFGKAEPVHLTEQSDHSRIITITCCFVAILLKPSTAQQTADAPPSTHTLQFSNITMHMEVQRRAGVAATRGSMQRDTNLCPH